MTAPHISVVTGVAGGIGAAVATALRDRGDTVIGLDLQHAERVPAGIEFAAMDVTQESDWQALTARIMASHGTINSLVNTAGIIRHAPIDQIERAEWDAVTGVNQRGTWLGMRAAVPLMRAHGGGTIVNFSSGWGITAGLGNVAYQMSKGAIIAMTRAAAIEFAADSIRVNVVLPGWTDSPMTQVQPADTNAAIVAAVPLGRGAVPTDHTGAVCYLTSEAASYVSGASLIVDGAAVVL